MLGTVKSYIQSSGFLNVFSIEELVGGRVSGFLLGLEGAALQHRA